VKWAHAFLNDNLRAGKLSEADFGREPGQEDGLTELTSEGLAKANELFAKQSGRPMTSDETDRLNNAAAARFEYQEGKHYVVDPVTGKIYIVDHETTDEVLHDPKTGIDTRWHGGMHQALEAEKGKTIHADPDSSNKITAGELLRLKVYKQVVGASGTANGHEAAFSATMGAPVQVADVPRYFKSLLVPIADSCQSDPQGDDRGGGQPDQGQADRCPSETDVCHR